VTTPAEPAERLQPGIFFRHGERPPACYRLLLLNVAAGSRPRDAADAIARVLEALGALATNEIGRDLENGTSDHAGRPEAARLSTLVAYGARLFDPAAHEPPLTAAPSPRLLRRFEPDDALFFSLPFAENAEPGLGQADLALQFLAPSEDLVARAAVEAWKTVADESLPLEIVGSFEAFQRQDGRGWLEFHDGVSNVEASQRRRAIQVSGSDPPWMKAGTYMSFLRLAVDLPLWRSLPRDEQEAVVGRQKVSGCPLADVVVDEDGLRPVPINDCPPGPDSSPAAHAAFVDAPSTGKRLVEASHIHRSNQNRGSPEQQANFRIFRQGFDYFDGFRDGRPVVGLNFVSFQAGLDRLLGILQTTGWLGDVNFGGPAAPHPGEPRSPSLMSIVAGGFYAVPSRALPFPGAELFGSSPPA